ncbi:hypothetical protein HDU99_008378 [Rhizoclosmatium hyalinum]|nr:hypothetical protein HDU99_008378 [Rhizoclosmatium hyalinum]
MHALIVGSGLVGAATAIALSQVGIESTLYDQVDLVQAALNSGGAPVAVDFGDSGGSVVLAASGLRVIRTLGLLDEVMAASLPSKTTYWFKIDGSAPIALDAANVNRKAGETDPALQPPVQILRSKLHSILMQACHKAGVRCFTGKKLSGVVEEEQGVTAKFADGSSATGDFLIGADGIHSATRRAIFGANSRADFTGCIGHIGVVCTAENNIPLRETCAFYLEREKKQMVCTFKISEELAAVQVMTFNDPPPVEGEEYRPHPDLPKESTRKSFRISPAAIYDLPDLPTYHKECVLLIGDAALGMVPNAVLGLLTGLEDVGDLLELFRHYQAPSELSKVIALYSQLRVPRGHDAAKRSREMVKQYYEGSQTMGHFMLRFGIFLFNYNLVKYYNLYDCPTEVQKAISLVK